MSLSLPDDHSIREGAEVIARWISERESRQERARVIEVRPNSLEVETDEGKRVLLPRRHSIRWSREYGAFPTK